MTNLGLKRLGGHVALALGRQLFSGLLQLISLAVIARVYGPEGNGMYMVALLVPSTLVAFFNLGIAPSNVYYLGSRQASLRTVWYSTLIIYFAVTVLGLLGGSVILMLNADEWFSGVRPTLLWLALLTYPITLLLFFVSGIFQGLQKFRQYNTLLIIQPVLTLYFIFILLLFDFRSVIGLLLAYMLASLIALLWSIIKLRPYLVNDDKVLSKGYVRTTLSYGLKAHASNMLTFVNYKADLFLVNFFIGPGAVGVYAIAVQLAEKLWLLSQAVSTVLLPKLAELSNDDEKRKIITPLVSRWVLWITLLGGGGVLVIVSPTVNLIFGDSFVEAILPIYFLMPGIILLAPARILSNDLASRGRPDLNMYTSLGVVLVTILSNMILIPVYGVDGAAISTSIAYSLNYAVSLVMYQYFSGVSAWSSICVTREDFYLIKSLFNYFYR